MNHAGETSHTGFPVELVTLGNAGVVTPPLRSLAIVGSHPATRELAPYEDPNWEIWLFNEAAQKPSVYRRWDALLQMHKPEVYRSLENWVNKDHWAWLQQDHGDKRIFMHDVDPLVPNSVRYPLEDVLALIPHHYLRSSPALALGLAIHLGYRTIALYGSELSSNTEYHYQAINYAYWIGFALGRGIDLRLECWQSEFDQPIYGYEGEMQIDNAYFEERKKFHEQEYGVKKRQHERLTDKLADAMFEKKFYDVAELQVQTEELAMSVGQSFGALSEAKYYLERQDHISRQEFERRSAYAQLEGEKLQKQTAYEGGKSEYVWNIWKQTGRLEALNQLREFIRNKTDLAFQTGTKHGIFKENIEYMNEFDKRVQALGGVRAVHQIQGGTQ